MDLQFSFLGAKIAYSIKGKGRSVFLIHGFLANKRIWKDYQNRLSKKYQVVAIDLAGHGNSECIGYAHTMEIFGDSVKALMQHLNIRKAIFVGHSLGGYVSMAFAEKHPDNVLGLIMMNSTAKGDSKQRIQSRNQLIDLIKQNKDKALELLVPSFFSVKKRNTHWQVKGYLRMAKQCSERGIIATIEGMKIRKEREIVLKFAPFPYLYIIGLQDQILVADFLKNESKLGENGAFVLLENGSHMCLLEEIEKVYRIIKQFSALTGNQLPKNISFSN